MKILLSIIIVFVLLVIGAYFYYHFKIKPIMPAQPSFELNLAESDAKAIYEQSGVSLISTPKDMKIESFGISDFKAKEKLIDRATMIFLANPSTDEALIKYIINFNRTMAQLAISANKSAH